METQQLLAELAIMGEQALLGRSPEWEMPGYSNVAN
jgi:hypothetical protein